MTYRRHVAIPHGPRDWSAGEDARMEERDASTKLSAPSRDWLRRYRLWLADPGTYAYPTASGKESANG